MDIKNLLEKMQKFAGEPEQKPGDQVRGTDMAKKSGKGKKHPFLNQLVGDSKKNEYKNKLIREFEEFKGLEEDGSPNTVSLDVPLMIRLFEYAREDAKSDMDLHFVAERMIELSQKGRTLSMDDYNSIVGQATEAIDPPSSQGTTTDPAKPGQPVQKTPADLAKEKAEQQNLTKSLSQLKSAGIDINTTQAQSAFSKADTGVALNPTDKETVSKLAPAVGDIIANPQLAGQFKALVQKAQQQSALEKK